MEESNNENQNVGSKIIPTNEETVFCRTCGQKILKAAEICPYCGVRQISVQSSTTKTRNPNVSSKSRGLAAILAFFLGMFGAHRFYTGKTGSAIAMIFVSWLTLGIWPFVDFIMILCGTFKDNEGKALTEWDFD